MNALVHAALSNAVLVCLGAAVAAGLSWWWRNPAWRHCLWLLVLLKFLTPPLVDLPLGWPDEIADRLAAVDRTTRPAAHSSIAAAASRESSGSAEALNPPGRPSRESSGPMQHGAGPAASNRPAVAVASGWAWPQAWTLLLIAWATGSVLWFALAARAIVAFRRLLSAAEDAPADLQRLTAQMAARLGLRRVPRTVLVQTSLSPLLWAVGRHRTIVLPRDLLARMDRDEIATLLLHELAHLRRRDHIVRLLEFVACGLYWWHPVLWWMRRELHRAEEQCCDAWVAWANPQGEATYASALLRTLEYVCEARARLLPLANGIGQMRQLKQRLKLIVAGSVARQLDGWGRLSVATLALAWLPWCMTRERIADHETLATPLVASIRSAPSVVAAPRIEGPASLEELHRRARVDEKYQMLLAQFAAPDDAAQYGPFADLGYQDRAAYQGREDLPSGYWVYAAPYWYIWGSDGRYRRPPRPWSPEQATGAPNTFRGGDLSTAWASLSEDDRDEWLLLEYAEAFVPAAVRVYETYRPGALVKITAFRLDGEEVVVWEGNDPTPPSVEWGVSEVSLAVDFPTRRLRLHLQSTAIGGWNEIDAVALLDSEGREQWASAARGSTSYGDLHQVVVRSGDGNLARPAEVTWIVISPEALARAEQRIATLEEELRRLRRECRELAKLRATADEISRLLRNEGSAP